MAQIDSRIALGFQPTAQIESPVNNLARILQVQGAQQANQLNQLRMDEYQSGVQRKNRLASLLGGQYGSDEERESALLRGGFMDEAQTLGKNRQDRLKGAVELDEKRVKLATERYGMYKKSLGALAQRPDLTKDMMIQVGEELVNAGIIPVEMHQKAIASMPDDPNQLRMRLREGVAAQLTPEQMLTVFSPKAEKIDSGQQIMFRDTNPNSPTFGQNVGGAPVQKQMTPGEVASNKIAQGNLAVAQGNLGVARSRLAFDQGNAVSDAGGPNQVALTKQYGKASPGYRWKADGTQEAIPGGPADIKAGEAGAKAQARADAAALAAGNVLSAVSEAKNLVGYGTSGIGAGFARLPGTPARDLQAKLDTVKANLGFDRLQQMREMSPTGGALGAVAVQELIALQSTVASLDQAQSPTELRKSLEKIEGHYNKWLETVNKGAATPAKMPDSGNTVNVGGQQYTRPAGMTDQQWADYKKAVGVSQ